MSPQNRTSFMKRFNTLNMQVLQLTNPSTSTANQWQLQLAGSEKSIWLTNICIRVLHFFHKKTKQCWCVYLTACELSELLTLHATVSLLYSNPQKATQADKSHTMHSSQDLWKLHVQHLVNISQDLFHSQLQFPLTWNAKCYNFLLAGFYMVPLFLGVYSTLCTQIDLAGHLWLIHTPNWSHYTSTSQSGFSQQAKLTMSHFTGHKHRTGTTGYHMFNTRQSPA